MPDHLVDPIDDLTNELLIHKWSFYLVPRLWTACTVDHLDWSHVKFGAALKAEVPKAPGIYTLLANPYIANHPSSSYLMYVGKSKNLRRRFSEYLAELRTRRRPKIYRFLKRYEVHVQFCYAVLDETLLDTIETALMEALQPPCNSDFKGDLGTARRAFK